MVESPGPSNRAPPAHLLPRGKPLKLPSWPALFLGTIIVSPHAARILVFFLPLRRARLPRAFAGLTDAYPLPQRPLPSQITNSAIFTTTCIISEGDLACIATHRPWVWHTRPFAGLLRLSQGVVSHAVGRMVCYTVRGQRSSTSVSLLLIFARAYAMIPLVRQRLTGACAASPQHL